jgi:cardiolipin synthase
MPRLLTLSFFFLVSFLGYTTYSSFHIDQPVSKGDTILFSNEKGDDLSRIIRSAINSAKTSIVISIFNISDDGILSLLRKKANEGVSITIYYDSKASSSIPKKLNEQIKLKPWIYSGLMHQKILIVDKSKIWVGSANFSWSSLNIHSNLIAAFESREGAEFLESHLLTMLQGKEQENEGIKIKVGSQNIQMFFLPDSGAASDKILQLINEAKKAIRVAMYTWTRQDFAHALVNAKLRGVSVEAIVDNNSLKGASLKVQEILKKHQINTYLYEGKGLLHHKFMWVDGSLVSGSANWTKAAFTQNREFLILIQNLTTSQEKAMKTIWETIISESKPLYRR